MATYVITGASRGIGLELTRQLLDLPATQVSKVFALSRSQPPAALNDLIEKHQRRAIHVTAAVDSTESVQQAAKDVEAKLDGQGLDVLVNNAGVTSYHPEGTKTVPPEQLLNLLDANVVGPHRMIVAFLPLLEKGKQKKVINVSSTLGSIAWARRFPFALTPGYKTSKAALNMLNAQYAMDYADTGFTFLLVSPGWLKTDLGSQSAEIDVEVGVAELKRIILEASPAQNGKFVNIYHPGLEGPPQQYDGGEIPW